MKSVLAFLAFAALALSAAPTSAAPAPGLEVRFCPEAVARPYPLDSLHGVQSLLLQNVAVVNRGATPAEVTAVTIELLRGGEVVDSRTFQGAALGPLVKTGPGLKASGMLDALGFQFCEGRLMDGSAPAATAALNPNETLLLMQQPFAYKGARDQARVRVTALVGGKPVEAVGLIRIDAAGSNTVFRFPLAKGRWLIGAASSFHTTHRWGVPEEFALDIFATGPNGLSHRGDGSKHTDFYAYGAPVVAAADGVVVKVEANAPEDPPLLRRPGEAMDAYYGRIGEAQGRRFAAGGTTLTGAYVILDHGNGEYSVYVHLKPGSATMKPGQRVKAGDVIGRVGSSGNSTEAHLHFQVCDRPEPLNCTGIVPTFAPLEILNTDGPRPLQSGDVVEVK